jgi:hypothetical protein
MMGEAVVISVSIRSHFRSHRSQELGLFALRHPQDEVYKALRNKRWLTPAAASLQAAAFFFGAFFAPFRDCPFLTCPSPSALASSERAFE